MIITLDEQMCWNIKAWEWWGVLIEDGEDNREDDYAYNGAGHNDEDRDGGDEQEEGRLRIRVSLEGMWFWRSLPAWEPTPAPAILKTVARQGHRSLMRPCLYPQDTNAWENRRDSPHKKVV